MTALQILDCSLHYPLSLSVHVKYTPFLWPSLLWWCPVELSVMIELFRNHNVQYSSQWGLSIWNVATMIEELSFFFKPFKLPDVASGYHTGQHNLVFSDAFSLLITLFYTHLSLSTSTKCLAAAMRYWPIQPSGCLFSTWTVLLLMLSRMEFFFLLISRVYVVHTDNHWD